MWTRKVVPGKLCERERERKQERERESAREGRRRRPRGDVIYRA